MEYKAFQNISLSRLGMGNMRLPSTNPKEAGAPIDHPKAHEVIAKAYHSGINYFDTAHVYNGGDSETCVGEAMEQFPRDSYYLATKYNVDAEKDYKGMFEKQLKRLRTDHIDFYLIHCLTNGNIEKYLENGSIEYFLEQKEKGRITYLGFSSHAAPEVLARFADHHAWDFAQLQLNYFDWLFGTTKEEYEILEERIIPIMVMEPVRGGRLSNLTPQAEKLLQDAHPDWSISSWALRFVRSLPQVQVILSGMSNLEQVEDNVKTFSSPVEDFTEADRELLFIAGRMFKEQVQVPCTACRYCTAECPVKINIPEFLRIYNDYKVNGDWALQGYDKVESEGKPTDCIACGACTGHCPQSIDIPGIMAKLAELKK